MPHSALPLSEHLQHAIEQLESLQLPHNDETSDRCSPIDRQTQTQTRASTNCQSPSNCETKPDKRIVSISRTSSDSDSDSDDDDRDRYSDRDSDRCSDGASDGDDDDLIPRGPANSRSTSSYRSQPYQRYLPQPQHSQTNENEGVQLLIQEVLNNPVFNEVLNNCLDQLQLTQAETSDCSRASRKDLPVAIGPVAGNDLSDNLSLLESVQSGTFQAAQLVTEESSACDPYLLSGNAIPSASESQHLTGCSPVRSPRENDYRGSRCAFPQFNLPSYSSLDSTANHQGSVTATYRAAPKYFSSPSCSPSSSNQSYADASSPKSLQQMIAVDPRQASEPVDPHNRNDSSLNLGQLLNHASEESPYSGPVTEPSPIQFSASPSSRANIAAMASSVSDNVVTRRSSESARNHLDNSVITRESDRNTILRPYINLPFVRAYEDTFMQRLSFAEVEKAMSTLLKRSVEDLAMQDEDGDTPLMRLVGNPDELDRKMAYLVPLVDRLSTVTGTLTATNARGEDALYLAALNSNRFPFVAAYLVKIMQGNKIDVSQRLYHARGETLLHLVAAQGDSHKQMLDKLLALEVFDLGKCNSDGRTALHVAVESPEPLASVKLLLDHGADPSAKEKKHGNTALHLAISSRHGCDPRLVKLLLDGRAHDLVNATNCNRDTPLHVAAAMSGLPFERQKEICLQLTDAGSATNLPNLAGKTPLDLVSSTRRKAIQRIFSGKHVATLESSFNSLQF